MDRAAVCDASPLIYMARADRLWLVQSYSPTIVVPREVVDETTAKSADNPASNPLFSVPWLRVVETPPIAAEIQSWELGRGEAAVLAWAQAHAGSVAILDDLQARKCARALQVPLIGTLGLVLRAKQIGLIARARPEMDRLVAHGMYLSARVQDEVLALVGE